MEGVGSIKGRRALVTVYLLALTAVALVSCSTFEESQKKDTKSVSAAIEAFGNAIRWEEYRAAASMLAPEIKEQFWELVDKLQGQVRVMEVQVREISLSKDARFADAYLRYRYYKLSNPSIQTKTVHQRFRYLEKEKAWQMTQHDLDQLAAGR